MALSPLNTTRVSFNQQTNALLDGLRRKSYEILNEEGRLSSGLAFTAPSQDPAAATRVLSLDGELSRQGQVAENLRHATSFLDATEGAITEISTLLSDAHSIASQNVGALASAEEREAAAELIADIVEQLVAIGNRQFNGSYLFGGRRTQVAPFVSASGGYAFIGDTGDILAQVDLLDSEPINLTGDQLFGALSSRMAGTIDLTPRLTAGTRLEDIVAADGSRLNLGQLVIGQVTGDSEFRIDLTGADTLGDIVDRINEVAGTIVSAALGDDGITLTPSGGPLSIIDIGTGSIARDLGLFDDSGAGGAITGLLTRRISQTTLISDLVGGAGVDLSGGLIITNGDASATIDLSGAQTVQELINAINTAGINVRAEINAAGDGIDIINLVSGSSMSISEDSGTTAAALGLRTMDLTTPLSELNSGNGVETVEGLDDMRITAKDGSTVDVNLDDAVTIGDVIDLINDAAGTAGVSVTASLDQSGNGIRIADSTGGSGTLTVSRLNLSYAIDDLGLGDLIADPAVDELFGRDVNLRRTESVLTSLLDLEAALRNDDEQAITAAGERVFGFISQVNRVQGVVGARAKAMAGRQDQTAAAVFATEQLVSQIRDLDYAEAITEFQLAQTALQATLLAGSQALNLSLLNFLG